MLRIFPMSLTRAACRWLKHKPCGSIITWETLKKKFLSKYCPPAQTAKKMKEINNFQQELDKTLYQAWERFKKLLIMCPQHYLTDMQEVILFYKELHVPTRQILDSKGVVPSIKAVDAKKAIQDMADILYRVDGDDFVENCDNVAKDEDPKCWPACYRIIRRGNGCTVGRGGRGRRPREGNDECVDDLNGQGNDQGLRANGGVDGVNENVEGVNGGIGGAPEFSTIIS
ncbi:hypothetical protein Tco_1410258 [Tanacetum coccineum]